MIKLTTETGSYYHFTDDLSRWQKNSTGWLPTWEVAAVPEWWDDRGEVQRSIPKYAAEHGDMGRLPVVGECLYVHHHDEWWLSRPVVSIEEVAGE